MKSLTWPRTRSVIWLCAGRPLNLSTSPAKFAGLGTITWSRKYNVSKLSCDYRIEVSREFFGTYSWWVSTLLNFGYTGIMKVEIYHFLFVTWPLGRCVTWLCGWGPLILSDHPTSLGSIGLVELQIMAFVISVPIPIPIPMPRFQCPGLQMAALWKAL